MNSLDGFYNPSVTGVTAPFTQGSLGDSIATLQNDGVGEGNQGDSYSQTLVVSQDNSLARATALRMTESAEGKSGRNVVTV